MEPAALIAAVAARLSAAGVTLPPAAPGRSSPLVPAAPAALAARIDHTLLRADATAADIERLCAEANAHGFCAVCVNPGRVALAASLVRPPVRVCSVADFPLGAGTTELRASAAARAVEDGAQEVDVVLPVGRLLEASRAGEPDACDERALRAVQADLVAVVDAVRDAAVSLPARQRVVKVILETCLLDARQKIAGALLAAGAGADFVKTSTGFAAGGATPEDVRLLRATVGPAFGVKASGGIRTRADALALIAAGADRLGCSASVAIARPD